MQSTFHTKLTMFIPVDKLLYFTTVQVIVLMKIYSMILAYITPYPLYLSVLVHLSPLFIIKCSPNNLLRCPVNLYTEHIILLEIVGRLLHPVLFNNHCILIIPVNVPFESMPRTTVIYWGFEQLNIQNKTLSVALKAFKIMWYRRWVDLRNI